MNPRLTTFSFFFLLLAVALALALDGCGTSRGATPTPTPTPPVLIPHHLKWNANPASENVLYYNVYVRGAGGLYSYVETVLVPAPLSYTIPLGTPVGTTYAVTASDGAIEGARSDDAIVTGPSKVFGALIGP